MLNAMHGPNDTRPNLLWGILDESDFVSQELRDGVTNDVRTRYTLLAGQPLQRTDCLVIES
jgi:hypothetical protein